MAEIHAHFIIEGDIKKKVVKQTFHQIEATTGADHWDLDVLAHAEFDHVSPTGAHHVPRNVTLSLYTYDVDWLKTLGLALITRPDVRRVLLRIEDDDDGHEGVVWVGQTAYQFEHIMAPSNLLSLIAGIRSALDDGDAESAYSTLEYVDTLMGMGGEL